MVVPATAGGRPGLGGCGPVGRACGLGGRPVAVVVVPATAVATNSRLAERHGLPRPARGPLRQGWSAPVRAVIGVRSGRCALARGPVAVVVVPATIPATNLGLGRPRAVAAGTGECGSDGRDCGLGGLVAKLVVPATLAATNLGLGGRGGRDGHRMARRPVALAGRAGGRDGKGRAVGSGCGRVRPQPFRLPTAVWRRVGSPRWPAPAGAVGRTVPGEVVGSTGWPSPGLVRWRPARWIRRSPRSARPDCGRGWGGY